MNLLLLKLAHDVDDSLKNMLNLAVRQWSFVRLLHRFKDLLLPFRFINGKIRVVLELADLSCCRGALVDQLNDLEVHFIDFLTPVFYGHVVNAPLARPASPRAVRG